MHGFNRTVEEVAKIVGMSADTLQKRINEFLDTPSAKLSPEAFMTISLDTEADPPIFVHFYLKLILDKT